MDRSHPFLIRLRAVMQSLDDEALASLANRGLLRRAQKDLPSQPPTIVNVADDQVRIQAADGVVSVPELPAKSKCTCPATGICRHILMSLLYLRDDAELAAATAPEQAQLFETSPADESSNGTNASANSASAAGNAAPLSASELLAAVTDDELIRWAGKPLFRKALKSLSVHSQVEIEAGASLQVRFPTRNITCRWIPGGGLLGMMCSCQAEAVCEHVVAAVVAYQVSLGKRQISYEETAPTESSGAPRTRVEVLASVTAVLREMIGLGLARVSAATRQRLMTLAVSAHGVDLPRLERMLKALADDVELVLRRDAQAATAGLLGQCARVQAICTALRRGPSAALVGVHRTQYYDVGQISLIGLGAHRWRSKGGYHGLTLYFWDESSGRWATWSESRPVSQPGFDPVGRYRAEGPWSGCISPQVAAVSRLRLTGAWRNPQGRISGRPATRALVVGPSNPQEVPEAFNNWEALAKRARDLFGGGLSEQTEHRELALLTPRTWGPPSYDPLRQELTRPILDDEGRVLELWLPFSAENETAINLLERHDPAQTRGLLGAVRLVGGRIRVQPISLIGADRIISLNIETAAAATTPSKKPPEDDSAESIGAADEDDEDFDPSPTTATALGRMLATAEAELEAMAESGLAARRDFSLLGNVARRLQQLGLTACAIPLSRLLESTANSARTVDEGDRADASLALLHAYYVLRLATEQDATALACAQLTT